MRPITTQYQLRKKKLALINTNILKTKMQDLKAFEILNAEKIKPHFLSLAKPKNKTDCPLKTLKKEDGGTFECEDDIKEHVLNFYSNLYRPDPDTAGEIEDFLGPEIAAHPLVNSSKLSEVEKLNLDRPLTLLELDLALKTSNFKSAPGKDGYSYRIISKFWHLFDKPLLLASAEGLENGALPKSFLEADIKIIPKKGDTTQIKNWRPISLLSNFYKILSRAINNRLKSVSGRILSRAQKGFNQKRFIHEVLINVFEAIDYCKREKISGALVSIDQSKAFDSVDHRYMEKIYRFFGFGPVITRWLRAIGTGRTARISLGNGRYTDYFPLLRGHAQGDSPSPLLYNFAAQILLFKIELSDGIRRVVPNPMLPGLVKPSDHHLCESNKETGKCDCFADDNSTITMFDFRDLNCLKNILLDFKKISGLSTNIEKSAILRIGNTQGDTPPEITSLGFKISTEIELLGFTVSNDDICTHRNFERVLEKVKSITRFWDRFNLTLSGKLNVYKSLLLSQLTYKATILMPDKNFIDNFNEIAEKFVLKGLSVAKNRLYKRPADGGIGMIDLNKFIIALHTAWIPRAVQNCNDNWKYDLLTYYNFTPESYTPPNNDIKLGTVLTTLVNSFEEFKTKHLQFGNNFLDCNIFFNQNFGYGHNMLEQFTGNAFTVGQNPETFKLISYTWRDFSETERVFFEKNVIERKIGATLKLESYNSLKKNFTILIKRFYKTNQKSIPLKTTLMLEKKGSRRYRNILENECSKKTPKKIIQAQTFFNSINYTLPFSTFEETRIKSMFSSWSKIYYNNQQKTFLFKMYNNILGLNIRVSKFNREISPECTFCTIEKRHPTEREHFIHLFYYCPTTASILAKWFGKYSTSPVPPVEVFFVGNIHKNKDQNNSAQFVYETLQFTIWQFKLLKKIPSFTTFELEVENLLNASFGASKKIWEIVFNNRMFRRYGE